MLQCDSALGCVKREATLLASGAVMKWIANWLGAGRSRRMLLWRSARNSETAVLLSLFDERPPSEPNDARHGGTS